MYIDLKFILLVCANLVLYALTTLLNTTLAPYAIHLSAAGLSLIAVALLLNYGWGVCAVALQGLLVDSYYPVEQFGFHCVLFAILFTLLRYARYLLEKSNRLQFLAVCIGLNTAIQFILALYLGSAELWAEKHYWLRIVVDSTLSSLLILLIAEKYILLSLIHI